MKFTLGLLFLLMSFATTSLADTLEVPAYAHKFQSSKTGEFEIKVVNIGEPPVMPFRLTIDVTCYDQSVSGVSSVKRTYHVVHESVCDFFEPEFNSKKKVLSIQYMDSKATEGVAKCNRTLSQTFDLAEFCSHPR